MMKSLKCIRMLGLALALWAAAMPGPSLSAPQPVNQAGLQGEVRAISGRGSIAGAQVSAPELGLSAATNASGRFAWPEIPLPNTLTPITVTITAPGYGAWTVQNLLLLAGDTLILTPELGSQPFLERLPLPNELRGVILSEAKGLLGQAEMPAGLRFARFAPHDNQLIPKLSASQSNILASSEKTNIPQAHTLPETIRVGVTGIWQCDPAAPYRVVTVDFKEYVKHVLPNEWYYSWPRQALKAGALAVKMYAWYFIEQGGKWLDADVLDNTCDQWYRPYLARASTNQAVDETWPWMLTRNGLLFPTYHKDIAACDPPNCMRQSASALLARGGQTWDRILAQFYTASQLAPVQLPPGGFALRFSGVSGDGSQANRLVFPPDPTGQTAEFGWEDFTLEWWLKAYPEGNTAPAAGCGSNQDWKSGDILLEYTSPGEKLGFGVSLAGGRPVFAVTGAARRSLAICAPASVTDGRWHHMAIQRRAADGFLWLFLDGELAASGVGPGAGLGETGYADPPQPGRQFSLAFGGGIRDTDLGLYSFYQGLLDEIRISNVLRYVAGFSPPETVFPPDENTLALVHLDEGLGKAARNASPMGGGMGDGFLLYGGSAAGPEWIPSDLFLYDWQLFLPSINQ